MIQAMLDTNAEEDSDGESSADDLDALKVKLEKAGLKKAADPRQKTAASDNQLIK
jgi:hypothetical protein